MLATKTRAKVKDAPEQLPLREITSTGWLSSYRRFWRGCDWEPFLMPIEGGFEQARMTPACHEGTNNLLNQPGTYELAIVKGNDSKRFKIYVGQTGSIRRRFHHEYRGSQGSHLRPFFDEALQQNCQIWRRCRYTETADDARRTEAQFLKQYDYAWNVRQAGCEARHVDVVRKQSCFGGPPHLVSKPAATARKQAAVAVQLDRVTYDKGSVPGRKPLPRGAIKVDF